MIFFRAWVHWRLYVFQTDQKLCYCNMLHEPPTLALTILAPPLNPIMFSSRPNYTIYPAATDGPPQNMNQMQSVLRPRVGRYLRQSRRSWGEGGGAPYLNCDPCDHIHPSQQPCHLATPTACSSRWLRVAKSRRTDGRTVSKNSVSK